MSCPADEILVVLYASTKEGFSCEIRLSLPLLHSRDVRSQKDRKISTSFREVQSKINIQTRVSRPHSHSF